MQLGLRELMFCLLVVAMPVATYFFVFEPRAAQVNQAESELRLKRLKLAELEAAAAEFQDLGKQIHKLSGAIELFEDKLPQRRQEQIILQQVWELAARNNLLPKSIRPGKQLSTAHYSELPISLAIAGNFDGFYQFMLDLEKLSRIIRMPQLEIIRSPDLGGEVVVNMTLSIFFEAPDEEGSDQLGGTRRRARL